MKMQRAEMEFVAFDTRDVITTSGDIRTFTVSGLFDGKYRNLSFVDSSGTVTLEDATGPAMVNNLLYAEWPDDWKVDTNTKFVSLDGERMTAEELFSGANEQNSDSVQAERWNGIYQWLNDTFRRIL